MRRRAVIGLLLTLVVSGFGVTPSAAGPALIDEGIPGGSPPDTGFFHPFVGFTPGSYAERDLEFMWDTLFALDRGYQGFSTSDILTLRRLGGAFADSTGKNPFGAPFTDIRLVHDYFSPSGKVYNNSLLVPGFDLGGGSVPAADRQHLDVYIYNPSRISSRFGTYPSHFIYGKEDSTTAGVDVVWHGNSIMYNGPQPSQVTDTTSSGWTHPDSIYITGMNHEWAHAIDEIGGTWTTEMMSAGAEAIAGLSDTTAIFEVPYTWSLITQSVSGICGSPSDTCVRSQAKNYQGRTMFAAYLAYNYIGVDPDVTTLAGFQDDLLYRWAHSDDHSLEGLATQLADSVCVECVRRPYFKDTGGTALTVATRLGVLHHNWRVANYVNNPALADSQFGYPSQYGFDPAAQLRAWQDFDGYGTDDIVALPPVVPIGSTLATKDTSLIGWRHFRNNSYPLVIQPYGSEYWILRADTSLSTANYELRIRVNTESLISREITAQVPEPTCDGRLFASAVAYTQNDPDAVESPLWGHPEWAALAVPLQWVDVDSTSADIVLHVPGFGTTYKSVLLVLTLADGEKLNWAGTGTSLSYNENFKYRVDVDLRAVGVDSVEIRQVVGTQDADDREPAWAPDEGELVFAKYHASSGFMQMYRSDTDGGNESLLLGNLTAADQRRPDWSPRGDWVAFDQDSMTPEQCSVWLYNTQDSTLLKVTSSHHREYNVAFSPNGQSIAYVDERRVAAPGGGEVVRAQIVKSDLTGMTVSLLTQLGHSDTVDDVRWAPDGSTVFFSVHDSLFAVDSEGGEPVHVASVTEELAGFDLPVHGDELLVEEPGVSLVPKFCGSAPLEPDYPYRRLALVDTLLGVTSQRYFHTGAEYYRPRYAPSNTYVLYASSLNDVDDLDIFMGRIGFNRAPTFTSAPRDTVYVSCGKLQVDIDATDADGEDIDYSSAFLPSTATLNSETGVFEWDPPVSGEHFIVFRALDGSGGVAQKVVRIFVPDSIRPDSLTMGEALVSSNSAWIEWYAVGDDSLTATACKYDIRRNSSPITEGNWNSSTGVSGTIPSPASPSTYQQMQVTGLSPNTTYYFAMKVRDETRDHWSKLSNVIQVHTSGGGGLSARRSGPGESSARGATAMSVDLDRKAEAAALIGSSQALALELNRSGEGLSWLAYRLGEEETSTIAGGASGAQVVTQSWSGSEWTSVGNGSLATQDTILSIHSRLADGTRLVFIGDHRLVLASELAHGLEIQSAAHNRVGSLVEDLAPACGEFELDSGDSLVLVYAPTEEEFSPTAGFLTVRRVGSGAAPSSRLPQLQQLPKAFHLAQNQPNPFAAATTIRFDLPKGEQVRLEIFDAQGRRVARLANGWYPAGFHAVEWDRRGEGGRLQPGVYLYRIQAGAFRDQKKLVLLP